MAKRETWNNSLVDIFVPSPLLAPMVFLFIPLWPLQLCHSVSCTGLCCLSHGTWPSF